MTLVTEEDYRKFVSKNKHVTIEDIQVQVGHPWRITSFSPPKGYHPEEYTVWSFPNRGDWATHTGICRGNWKPLHPKEHRLQAHPI